MSLGTFQRLYAPLEYAAFSAALLLSKYLEFIYPLFKNKK